MRGLDETDREILDCLLADGRTPYSEIGDAVGLSGPAVSDRVDRLEELGVIQRFTIDVDRSMLDAGLTALLEISPRPSAIEAVADDLAAAGPVDHRFRAADGTLFVVATLDKPDAWAFLEAHTDRSAIETVEMHVLSAADSAVSLETAELDIACVECGNSVTSEGERRRIDDRVYHFCCENCEAAFLDRYERLEEGV
ncbi:MAG: AsnC family transcriptional regulator [Halococcoides sp.]